MPHWTSPIPQCNSWVATPVGYCSHCGRRIRERCLEYDSECVLVTDGAARRAADGLLMLAAIRRRLDNSVIARVSTLGKETQAKRLPLGGKLTYDAGEHGFFEITYGGIAYTGWPPAGRMWFLVRRQPVG